MIFAEAPEAVEGSYFIALSEGGVVEDGRDKVVHGAVEGHDGLADVDKLSGTLADDVHAEDLAGFAVEDELEPACRVAANLAARDFAIVGHTDFVGDILVSELFFGLADEADFGNGVRWVSI